MESNVGEDITFMIRVDRGNPQADVLGKTCDMHMLGQDQLSQTGQGPHRGIIKSYNETKGFGFIQCPTTEAMFQGDVFLHKKEFEKGLKVGCEVQFYLMLNNRGRPQASRVTMVQEADSTKGVEGLLALAGLEQESTEASGSGEYGADHGEESYGFEEPSAKRQRVGGF